MKLRRAEKKSLRFIGVLVYISGAALFIFSKWIRVASEVGEQHHPLEHWLRITHTLITYFIVIAFGYLVKGHIFPGLRPKIKRRIRSGLSSVSLFLVLMLTAVVILYGSDGVWTNSMSWIHSIVGLACPLLIFFHATSKSEDPLKVKKSNHRRIGFEKPHDA